MLTNGSKLQPGPIKCRFFVDRLYNSIATAFCLALQVVRVAGKRLFWKEADDFCLIRISKKPNFPRRKFISYNRLDYTIVCSRRFSCFFFIWLGSLISRLNIWISKKSSAPLNSKFDLNSFDLNSFDFSHPHSSALSLRLISKFDDQTNLSTADQNTRTFESVSTQFDCY